MRRRTRLAVVTATDETITEGAGAEVSDELASLASYTERVRREVNE